MYSNAVLLNAASYGALFSAHASSTLYVPVKQSALIYSQFSYVHGTAADQGQPTVPVSRIKILNTLISQLISMKQHARVNETEASGLSEERADDLIREYQKQVQDAVALARSRGFGLAGAMPVAGDGVSVLA